MNTEQIRIDLEVRLENELYTLLEGEMVEAVLKEASFEQGDNFWRNILQGHSFKVTPEMALPLYNLFSEVRDKLGYSKNIDFYITNTPELNAFAIPQTEENESDIINVNSGMIGMLDDDELRFVIGHEIGHLISRFARINRLIYFVFPDPEQIPLLLQHKIDLWKKLSELTSDRFGFLACNSLEKCTSGFFKLASGLDPKRIRFDYQAYLKENEKILEYFSANNGNILSHPVNPLRIKAVQLFSQSDLYSNWLQGKDSGPDQVLGQNMGPLVEVLLTLSTSELDRSRKNFLASGGLIMASIDNQVSSEELEIMATQLSEYTVFPKEFLTEMAQSGKVDEIFQQAVQTILSQNPSERVAMLDYLTNLVISDNHISKQEVDTIYQIGAEGFGLTRREVAQIVASVIQGKFMPNLYQ